MDELTDDMEGVLKAACRVAPNGETFILEMLPLDDMSEQARKDCAFTLWREPFCYIERRNEYVADAAGGRSPIPDPRGTPYALTKLGRPKAKQLVADESAARRTRYWTAAKYVWGIAMTIAVGVAIKQINSLSERQHIPPTQPAPTTQQTAATSGMIELGRYRERCYHAAHA